MNFFKNKFFSFLLFLIFTVFNTDSIWALIIADIDETRFLAHTKISFSPTQEKTSLRSVRVAAFDVDQQKFTSLQYCMAPNSRKDTPYKASFSEGFDLSYSLDGASLEIVIDPATLHLTNDFWIVCAKSAVKGWDAQRMGLEMIDIPFDGTRSDRVLIRRLGESYNTGDLKEFLTKFEKRRKKPGAELQVTLRLDDEGVEGNLKLLGAKDGCANYLGYDDETGFLGEVATDLTMMAFGFVKLPAKLSSNNGFDGIYVPLDQTLTGPLTQMWVTEAKCRNSPPTQDEILSALRDKFRSDKALGDTRSDPREAFQNTATLIYRFIDSAPLHVFLLAQRVLGDGAIHSKVEVFNPDIYWETEEKLVAKGVRRIRPKTEPTLLEALSPYREKTNNDLEFLRDLIRQMGLSEKVTLTPTNTGSTCILTLH